MSDMTAGEERGPSAWMDRRLEQIATGVTGVIAVIVALKTVTFAESADTVLPLQDYVVRASAFSSMTIWTALTIGLHRRGVAAMVALGFALCLELIFSPLRGVIMPALGASSFGIGLSYLGLHLYWYRHLRRDPD